MKRSAPLRRSRLERSARTRRGRRALNARSPKRAAQERVYRKRRDLFLARPENRQCRRCGAPASCVHHQKGRRGWRLLDETYWAASCADCNDFAETRTGEALAEGWLLRIESAA